MMTLSRRLYRAALRLLPVEVRERHGAEMSRVFDEVVHDARRRGGTANVVQVVASELRDLLRFALSAHRQAPRTRSIDERMLGPEAVQGGRPPMLASLLQDLRYAARLLRRSPAFTAVGLITVALAIGANTAIFTVFHSVVLRSLPFPEADRVMVFTQRSTDDGELGATTPGTISDLMSGTHAFSAMAAFASTARVVTVDGNAERIPGCLSVGSLFDVLGRSPAEGRTLTQDDDQPGADPVVVLGAQLAHRLFGETSAVGRSIAINAVPHTVVGVMPPDFAFLDYTSEYWMPARFDAAFRDNRDQYFLMGIARLAPGVERDEAEAQLNTVMDGIRSRYPQYTQNAVAAVVPAKELLLDGVERRLGLLMGAVAFVLLIACANLGNLLLARGTHRRVEMAVRQALGAGAGRLIHQAIVEGVLLALLGGALGVALAVWLVRALVVLLPEDLPRLAGVALDGPALLFAFGATLATGLLFSAFPAIQLAVRAPAAHLREGVRGSSREGLAQQCLVISQLALALILLVGAGLLGRSFLALLEVPTGFENRQLLTFTAPLASPVYRELSTRLSFFERGARGIEALPGVKGVTFTSSLPVEDTGASAWFNMVDRPWPAGHTPPAVPYRPVRPNYFEVLGIPILRGRPFTEREGLDGTRAVIISESVARRFFPDRDPLGQRIYMGAPGNHVVPESEIVGVAADVKQRGLDDARLEAVYAPSSLVPWVSSVTYAIRASVPPESLVSAVRTVMRGLDPGVPLVGVRTMDDILWRSMAPTRSSMLLFGLFATVALLLALVGVFGVLSYTVSQRTTEFGIRMALGANTNDVRRLVLIRGLRLVGMGIVLGVAGAIVLARSISTMLFGVMPTDPPTLAAVAALLAGCAILAAYLPARRASLVDPIQAMRQP